MMPCHAIVPVKRFADAKARLAPLLAPHERRLLAQTMLRDVLDALAATRSLASIVAVTNDADAAALAAQHGAIVMDDPQEDLNAGLAGACAALARHGAVGALIVPCDVPQLTPADADHAVAMGRLHGVALAAASRDGGTNLLASFPADAVALAFGRDSAQRHLDAAHRAGFAAHLLARPSLDIDLPEDIAALIAAGGASRTLTLLRDLGVAARLDARAAGAAARSSRRLTGTAAMS
jgi:2-phospho-L-lactate guanylyltransferase